MRFSSAIAPALVATAAAVPCRGPYQKDLHGLNDIAQCHGKLWFGTATNIPTAGQDADAGYMGLLANNSLWGELTPENHMKYKYLEPEQGVFDYSLGDPLIEFAEQHGMRVRCHNLIWHTELPTWLSTGNWTAETLTAVMKNHITNVVQHFGDRCYSWDVVNEALNGDGTYSSGIWYETIGPEYVFLAFKFAQEAAQAIHSDVKLYYNDWGVESPGAKTNKTVALVEEFRSRGVRIDGIGLESHFVVGSYPTLEEQIQAKKAFIDMGLEVAITELDVRFLEAPYYTPAAEAAQAQIYYDTVASCMLAGPRCVGVTVWEYDDKYSWIPAVYRGEGGADLYNSTLDAKPAFYASQQALLGQDCTVC